MNVNNCFGNFGRKHIFLSYLFHLMIVHPQYVVDGSPVYQYEIIVNKPLKYNFDEEDE